MQRTLLTDVDDTLYNWVGSFAPSFRAMSRAISLETGFAETEILASFTSTFRHENTADFTKAIETNSLLATMNQQSMARIVTLSRAAFSAAMRTNLRVFDGVPSTLESLRLAGVKVVAVTNADATLAISIIDRLGLAKLIDGLVAWGCNEMGLDDDTHVHRELLKQKASGCGISWVETLPSRFLKPSLTPYQVALNRLELDRRNVWVLGDSQEKDLVPAEKLGFHTIWAKYPQVETPDRVRTLREIHVSQLIVPDPLAKMRSEPDDVAYQFADVEAMILR